MDQELIRVARRTDLAKFLVTHHPDQVKRSGNCVYLCAHDSVYTRFGFCGYTRFSTGETGNSIDFLRKYLGYSFKEAVLALTNGAEAVPEIKPDSDQVNSRIKLPEAAEQPYRRVYAYLTQKRSFPSQMVQYLIQEQLLYQEASTGNAVFVSRAKDFCELRGTATQVEHSFHGIRRCRPDCFWSIKNIKDKAATVAYICESSIDAVSLLLLQLKAGYREPAAYISIGGVRNQQTIDRIRASVRTVIAADNDWAGSECRNRNANLESIIPSRKDWNEDLQNNIWTTI